MENKDTRREIRRLLWRWGRVTATCIRKQREMREYMDLIDSVSDVHASALTGMPGSGKISDNTARAAEKLIYLKQQYQIQIDLLAKEIEDELRFRESIDDLLRCIHDPARTVIEMRYKYCWTHERVAREINYAESSVKRLEGVAITILEKKISIRKDDTN